LGKLEGVGRAVAYLVVLALMLEGCSILWPFLLQWTVDNVLVGNDRNLLISLLAGYALLAIVNPLMEGVRSWTTLYFSTHFHVQWTSNIFSHLLRLPVQFFERRSLGDLMSRFESVETIQRTVALPSKTGHLI
jgi:ATP-binding cassette subfamily B protein RaxB